MTRKQNVMSEVYIHFILYNLRRSASIFNPIELIKKLKDMKNEFLAIFSTIFSMAAHIIKLYFKTPQLNY